MKKLYCKRAAQFMLTLVLMLVVIPIPTSAAKAEVNENFVSVAEDGYERLVFGMQYLRVTQSSHALNPGDGGEAMDVAGKDAAGCDAFYSPCTLVVKKIYNKPMCHALFLQSKDKVHLADGSLSKITLLIIHVEDLSGYSVGQIFKQGQILAYESSHGYATGPHLHIEVARGTYSEPGWEQVKKDAWSLKKRISTDDAFFVSKKATTILKTGNYDWKELIDYQVEKAPVLMKVSSVNGSGTAPAHVYPEGNAKISKRYNKGDLVWATEKAINQYGNVFYKINGDWVYSKYLSVQKKETFNIALADVNLKDSAYYRLTNKGSGQNIQWSGKSIQMTSGTKNTAFMLDDDSSWHLLRSKANQKLVLNALADEPVHKSKVSLYSKLSADPTQGFVFEKAGGYYVVRLAYNPSLVLTQVKTGVQVRTYDPNNNAQLWKLSHV